MELLRTNAALTDNDDRTRAHGQINMRDDIGPRNKKYLDTLVTAGLVKCFPIPTILAALGVKHVDFFSLDVEGLEFGILKTFPFTDELRVEVRWVHAKP